MVALGALFLGPFFAHRKTVAEMRQAWINQLRDSVAELLSLSAGPEVTQFTRDRDADASIEPYSRLFLLENKIELLLNPDRDQHRILIARVHDLISLVHKSERELSEDQFIDRKADLELSITSATQQIIRREWTRTRNFLR
jgi:hypothetical protein